MRNSILASMSAGALIALVAPLQAQNEAVLRQAFEGKVVAVKIDMPATQQGVEDLLWSVLMLPEFQIIR